MSHVMRLLAPAKINLHLRVAPVNSDGFHPLQSWMCTVALFDNLTFTQSPPAPPRLLREPEITLTCNDPSLQCDDTNLVLRAARAIAPLPLAPLQIHLQKQIPTGGGLGGGSSDAARTLIGLNRVWQLKHSPDELSAIAATLGSDIAFFCHGPSSVCTGRGEIVRPIAPPTPKYVLLILPSLAVPTGPVYRRFDELLSDTDRRDLSDAVATQPDWEAWTKLSAEALLMLLVNDLERPAFDLNPALAKCRADVEQFLGRTVRMSGSGSSLFTLYDDELTAERAAMTLNGSTRPDGISLRVLAVRLAPSVEDDLISN